MKTLVVYLLHFEAPLGDASNPRAQAQHYLGSAVDLEARLEEHHRGTGARIMQVVEERRISWRVVRTWEGDRQLERRLKRRKNAPRLCPMCSGRAR